MKIDFSSDVLASSLIPEIAREMRPGFEVLGQKYSACDIELFYVFRSLSEDNPMKTRRRYDKKEKTVYVDLIFYREKIEHLSRDRQRYIISHLFFDYTKETVSKYRFENLPIGDFLNDLRLLCKSVGWLKEDWEVDLHLYNSD